MERSAEIAALYQAGQSAGMIAQYFGIKRYVIFDELKRAGVKSRTREEARKLAVQCKRWRGRPRRIKPGHRVPTANGYVLVYLPDHPNTDRDGYILEHRVIAEKELGRFLLPSEEVHHKNQIRDDNRPSNLEVKSKAAHRHEHWQELTPQQRQDRIAVAHEAYRRSSKLAGKVQAAAEMYAAGHSLPKVAVAFGVHRASIMAAFRRNNIPIRTRSEAAIARWK